MSLKTRALGAAVASGALAFATLTLAGPAPSGPATVGGQPSGAPASALPAPHPIPIPPRPTRTCASGFTGPTRLPGNLNPIVYACVRNSQRLVGVPICETPLLAQRPYADRHNHNIETYMCIPLP